MPLLPVRQYCECWIDARAIMAMSDALLQALGEHLQKDLQRRVFVLIDPMLREPLPQALADVYSAESFPVPVRHPGLKPDQRPRLVTLRAQSVDLLQATLDEALREQSSPSDEARQGFSIGGWLVTDRDVDVVARHLAQAMTACVPRSASGKMVRWADRRVLTWLWEDLDADQRSDLLGPIQSWTTIDRCGRLAIHEAAQSPQPYRPSKLTPGQWERAMCCEVVQVMLRGWRSFVPALPSDYQRQAGQAVSDAMGLGLESQQDIVLLGAYQLQLHPRLSAHPEVVGLVRQACSSGEALHKLLATIPDPDGWNRIRDELDGDLKPMQRVLHA